jgi:carbamoyl-phosphate synthase large subunit
MRFLISRVADLTLNFRNAVDFGLPLLNNPRTAQLFVESLERKVPQGGLRRYTEGRIPSEVKSWREFIGKRV